MTHVVFIDRRYTHALLWYITEDVRHARKAAEILDAWSAVYVL